MFRSVAPFAAVSLVIGCLVTTPVDAQVLHKLPKDGQWIEFEGDSKTSDGQEWQFRFRFSSVGAGTLEGKQARWIEIELYTRDGRDPASFPVLFKALVPEKLSESDDPGVVKCKVYIKEPSEEIREYPKDPSDVEEMKHLRSRHLGYVPPKAQMTEQGEEEIAYRDRKLKTKVFDHTLNYPNGTRTERRFWLTPEVPFGVAKFRWKVFLPDGSSYWSELTVTNHGTDAKPQLTAPGQ